MTQQGDRRGDDLGCKRSMLGIMGGDIRRGNASVYGRSTLGRMGGDIRRGDNLGWKRSPSA